jgi:hypothetical protein
MRMVYKNKSTVPVDSIAFTATYGGESLDLSDKGSFAPDVAIDHVFRSFAGLPYGGPSAQARCTVTDVHFTDGTSWP